MRVDSTHTTDPSGRTPRCSIERATPGRLAAIAPRAMAAARSSGWIVSTMFTSASAAGVSPVELDDGAFGLEHTAVEPHPQQHPRGREAGNDRLLDRRRHGLVGDPVADPGDDEDDAHPSSIRFRNSIRASSHWSSRRRRAWRATTSAGPFVRLLPGGGEGAAVRRVVRAQPCADRPLGELARVRAEEVVHPLDVLRLALAAHDGARDELPEPVGVPDRISLTHTYSATRSSCVLVHPCSSGTAIGSG